MNTIVPLISSGVAGPLGVIHLPRLWLKASLEARGKLAPGYPGAGKGYDQMVIDGLGLKRDAVLAFIKDKKPTYPEFAREAQIQGKVTLHVLVGKDGRVKNVKVIKGVTGLNEAAVDAIKKWVFKPALSNNKPVAVWVEVPMDFHF